MTVCCSQRTPRSELKVFEVLKEDTVVRPFDFFCRAHSAVCFALIAIINGETLPDGSYFVCSLAWKYTLDLCQTVSYGIGCWWQSIFFYEYE